MDFDDEEIASLLFDNHDSDVVMGDLNEGHNSHFGSFESSNIGNSPEMLGLNLLQNPSPKDQFSNKPPSLRLGVDPTAEQMSSSMYNINHNNKSNAQMQRGQWQQHDDMPHGLVMGIASSNYAQNVTGNYGHPSMQQVIGDHFGSNNLKLSPGAGKGVFNYNSSISPMNHKQANVLSNPPGAKVIKKPSSSATTNKKSRKNAPATNSKDAIATRRKKSQPKEASITGSRKKASASQPRKKQRGVKKNGVSAKSQDDASGVSSQESVIQEKKRLHNAAEKRRQQKISSQIEDLKNTVQSSSGQVIPRGRAHVLAATHTFLKSLLARNQQITSKNQHLEYEIQSLRKQMKLPPRNDVGENGDLRTIDGGSMNPYELKNNTSIQMFQRLECSISTVIMEMDRNLNICYVSRGIRYLTGETPRLLIGKNFQNMIHHEDVRRVRPKFRALLQKGMSSQFSTATVRPTDAEPIRYRRKKSGGGYVWVEAVGHSVGLMTGTALEGSQNMVAVSGDLRPSTPNISPSGTLSASSDTSSSQQYSQGNAVIKRVAASRITLVFSERNIERHMDLEAKFARQHGHSLIEALDSQSKASSDLLKFTISGGGVGRSTRLAAAASAGGKRR